MERLKYTLRIILEETDAEGNSIEREVLMEKSVPATDAGRTLAEKEAYGEIVPYDDGEPEEPIQPTDAERIAALEEQLAAAKILLGVE